MTVQELLKEAVSILSNLSEVEVEAAKDPLDDSSTAPIMVKVFAEKITNSHEAAKCAAAEKLTKGMLTSEITAYERAAYKAVKENTVEYMAKGYDSRTASRLATRDEYEKLYQAIIK